MTLCVYLSKEYPKLYAGNEQKPAFDIFLSRVKAGYPTIKLNVALIPSDMIQPIDLAQSVVVHHYKL